MPTKGKESANEMLYFDRLKRITKYQSVEQLRRRSGKDYGLSFEEALEYAYENVLQEAANAIKGKRRPKFAQQDVTPQPKSESEE